MKHALSTLAFIVAFGVLPARAGDDVKAGRSGASDAAAPDKSWGLTFKQKVMTGNQGYRMSDTSLDANLPYGLNLNADLTAYRNNSSSTSSCASR